MCRTRSQSLSYSVTKKEDVLQKMQKKKTTDVMTSSSLKSSTTIELDKYDIYVMGKRKGKPVFFTRLRVDGESAAHRP